MAPWPRTVGVCRRSSVVFVMTVAAVLIGREAKADALYTIQSLGTLPGAAASEAAGINDKGQIVGESSDSSGTIVGAFLYSNGQMTQITPIGGGSPVAINNYGQVAWTPNSGINDAGQIVSSATQVNTAGQVVATAPTPLTAGTLVPYAINNAGQMAGIYVPVGDPRGQDAAILSHGQIIDLSAMLGAASNISSDAYAINQKGDVLLGANGMAQGWQYYLYQPATNQFTNINAVGGIAFFPNALNDQDQAVGEGFLFSNGTTKSLLSLIPANSGWTQLNAYDINDPGQIVGSGTYNGQSVAFLMTPVATPEPGTLAVWGMIAAAIGSAAALRRGHSEPCRTKPATR